MRASFLEYEANAISSNGALFLFRHMLCGGLQNYHDDAHQSSDQLRIPLHQYMYEHCTKVCSYMTPQMSKFASWILHSIPGSIGKQHVSFLYWSSLKSTRDGAHRKKDDRISRRAVNSDREAAVAIALTLPADEITQLLAAK